MSRRPPVLRLLLWRARVPLTALAVLASCAVVVDALRPSPEPHLDVVVASRALEAGTELETGDLRVASWPRRLAPDGARDAVDSVRGSTLAVAVPAGMPLVAGVLADESLWADAPTGSVAAPVRLADSEVAGLLRTGDRVDVLAVAFEGGPAARLARGALVLRGPARADSAGGGLLGGMAAAPSGLVLLAVTPDEATRLAEHTATSAVVAVLVQ